MTFSTKACEMAYKVYVVEESVNNMNSCIYIEDLVANALIENIDRNHTRRVKFTDLDEYGASLTSWWLKNKHIAVTVLISKYYTNELLHNYSDFFEMRTDDRKELFICLREGKTVDDLRSTFRSYLSIDMLTSFIQAFTIRAGI